MKRILALALAAAALAVTMSSAAFACMIAEDEYPYVGVKHAVSTFKPQVLNIIESDGSISVEDEYPYKGRG